MSKQKHNRYQKKAAKNSIVEHITHGLPTKHNVKNTLLETGKDLVIGVLGGGLVGAAIGKPSLLVGLGVAGIGHFTEHHLATLFGIGIMVDSVNKLGLQPEDLTRLKTQYPGKSFIYVFQSTKDGNFRGENSFQHDVDVVIEVPEKGRAVQFGRFNQGGEVSIF